MIPVTKSYIPDIEEYKNQIERAFKNGWLTNRGELVQELEEKLKSYLRVDNILITTNGTIPIQIALKLYGKYGEIITTPFSYVATTSSIVWENCTPVFVDIDEDYLTIDEKKIEEKITDKTTCILATHVFGNPCNIEEISRIAKKHNLKVIYDAAHCFGVKYQGESVFNFGDVSTVSFHATKLFHTGEGGGIFTPNNKEFKKIYYSHNFGHNGPIEYHGLGINGKTSELQAAMGLCVFYNFDEIAKQRINQSKYYLENIKFSDKLKTIKLRENTDWNFSYFPLILDSETSLLNLIKELETEGIHPRRYFYPSLNKLPYIEEQSSENLNISESISGRIICLPLFHTLEQQQQHLIIQIINNFSNYAS